ncbi:MAG: M14 family metallopeptidase, partial [Gemmatimonadetes bacterium]|nr:M14 family metallopeptidase [Gemmatimonadota bacterium]
MRMPLASRALILSATAWLLAVVPAAGQEWPSTRPERSDYHETSRYDDVTHFLGKLEGRHPLLRFTSFGYSEEGRPLPLAVFGDVSDASAAAVRSSGATRVLVFANIHAGEVAGKEAAQVLARELAQGLRDRWADSLVVLVAPIYNADGNERIGLRNRPRQHGPVAGMGRRPNARGLDLNRDNAKLESAEARALSRLVQEYDPHVALDLHTTNGTFHAYHLTYAPPLHPSTDAGITALLREEWLPAVTESVRDRYGWEFFYYGNVPGTFGMRGERGWYTFDHRPRFTTNYLGLRNRFGILSEAYSYATFEDRILAHGRFVEAVIEFAFAN